MERTCCRSPSWADLRQALDDLDLSCDLLAISFYLVSSIIFIITMLVGTFSLSTDQTIEYLRTLPSIRERCGRVHDLAKQGKLQYFDYHPEKEEDVTNYCIKIIRVCLPFPYRAFPFHR